MDNKSKTKIDQYLQWPMKLMLFLVPRYSYFLFQCGVRNHSGCLYSIGNSPSGSRIPLQQE